MFSDKEKAEAAALLGDAFDSFKEQIAIYQTPTKTVVSSANGFNFAFGEEQPGVDFQYVTQSGVFWATIEYVDTQRQQELAYFGNTNLISPIGDVRISTTGNSARLMLEQCEKIVFDGKDFKRVSDILPRGLFDRNGFDCWLKKIDNG